MDQNSISTFLKGRKNNFDVIRVFAATLVIFSHSFALTLPGENKFEPLNIFSNAQVTFGHLAVLIFFVTSGFLITQSFDRSKSINYFLRSRILRIFPALLVVVFLTTFLLGPFVTSLSIGEYFSNPQTYNYLKNIVLLTQYQLPGVFETNIFVGGVNGSLWTLQYEFLFYLVVAGLGVFRLLKKKIVAFSFILAIALTVINFPIAESYIKMYSAFSSGMLFYLFRDSIKLNKKNTIISCLVLAFCLKFGGFIQAFNIFGSYLIFHFAFNQKIIFHNFSKFGDFSYGIYVFAFPIQQSITYLVGPEIKPIENFIFSLPITLFLSVLSWHLIEKPSMKLKKKSNFDVKVVKNNVA